MVKRAAWLRCKARWACRKEAKNEGELKGNKKGGIVEGKKKKKMEFFD